MKTITKTMYLYGWLDSNTDTVVYSAMSTQGMESQGYILINAVDVEMDIPDTDVKAELKKIKADLIKARIAELEAL